MFSDDNKSDILVIFRWYVYISLKSDITKIILRGGGGLK